MCPILAVNVHSTTVKAVIPNLLAVKLKRLSQMLTAVWQDADSGMYTCVVSSATGESSWSGMLTVRGTHGAHTLSLCYTSHSSHCHSNTTPPCSTNYTLTANKSAVCSHDKKKIHSVHCFQTKCWSESIHCCSIIITLSCLCNRKRSFLHIQSFWVYPASRASTEACSDGGDQRHRHPHLAVQPSWRRGRCYLLHYRGLQVRSDTRFHSGMWFENIFRKS